MVQKQNELNNIVICVVGLGYVGLPLALAFGKTNIRTYGFDINKKRINTLKKGIDISEELTKKEVLDSNLIYSYDEKDIKKANFIIIAVPTPINKANQPDLSLIKKASETVGRNLQKEAMVVYESTVYPGVTEDICGPILEKESGLKCGIDFKIGYSPERINPGDKEHTIDKIVKVVSAQDSNSLKIVSKVYQLICLAGVYETKNIKTAEAAKVIENTQRDINIALINELSLIFHRMNIDTTEVLEAAATKWNFLQFTPGLVGGHCIGVDPYYLVYKAEELGYHPQVISAGRRVNDYMPEFVAHETLKGLVEANKNIRGAKILILGLTFKENVKDIRNSKIADTINKLLDFGVEIFGFDPYLNKEEVGEEFKNIKIINKLKGKYDAIIIASAHKQFLNQQDQILNLIQDNLVVVDVKNIFRGLNNNKKVIYKNL